MFSKLKVEKVVNPPQNPVISKSFNVSFCKLFFWMYPKSKPISKQPKILAINVAQGNWKALFLEKK
jgi:hypothetical protein